MPARKSKDAPSSGKTKPKRHTWEQRKGLFTGVSAYKDVAGWLTAIADYSTRELKRKGILSGRDQVNVARVLDKLIRETAHATWWQVRCAEMGIDEPVPPTPDPPELPLDLGLPG